MTTPMPGDVTEPMTETELAAIRERLSKVPRGEWKHRNWRVCGLDDHDITMVVDFAHNAKSRNCINHHTAEFFANSKDDMRRLLAEVDRLKAWKESAMAVISEWDAAWVAASKPGKLGESKAVATAAEITRLRAKVAEYRGKYNQAQQEVLILRGTQR